MGLKATKYNGVVGSGSTMMESQSGTVGFQVMLTCEDGDTIFTIWLTEDARKGAERSFKALGVDLEKLKDPNYLEYNLGQDIEGREVSFEIKEDTYKGKTSLKVLWIGKKSEGKPAQAAAMFFGGKVVEPVEPARATGGLPQDPEDDIPF